VQKKKKDAEKEKKKAKARAKLQRGTCRQGSLKVEEDDDDDDNDGEDSDSSVPWDELVGEDEGSFLHPAASGPVFSHPSPASVQEGDDASREPADAGRTESGPAPPGPMPASA
jgi:hypothetical protein